MPITLGYHYPDVYSRHDDKPVSDKFKELCLNVKELTGSSILDKEVWDVIGCQKKRGDYQCICSCNELLNNFIVRHIPCNIAFTVGSKCIKKFENKHLNEQVAYFERGAPKCVAGNPIKDKRTHFGRLEMCEDVDCECKPCFFCPFSKFACICKKCFGCKVILGNVESWKVRCTDCWKIYKNVDHQNVSRRVCLIEGEW